MFQKNKIIRNSIKVLNPVVALLLVGTPNAMAQQANQLVVTMCNSSINTATMINIGGGLGNHSLDPVVKPSTTCQKTSQLGYSETSFTPPSIGFELALNWLKDAMLYCAGPATWNGTDPITINITSSKGLFKSPECTWSVTSAETCPPA